MHSIKIWFSDFWKGFDNYDNYFTTVLGKYFSIEVNPNPDFLIHSVYGFEYLKYRCVRICFTGENTRPDFSRSDYHIGFDITDDPRYLRWPLFLLYYSPEELIKPKHYNEIIQQKTRFCTFVVSNGEAKERVGLFNSLSEYKKVDSGGKFINNVGGPVENKMEFLRTAKFNIAYENRSFNGYTTEKIYESFVACSIPIYWGNPLITNDFNPKSFINASNFSTNKELVKFIKYVDLNETVYRQYIEEPSFYNNNIPDDFKEDKIIAFFNMIFVNINNVKKVARIKDVISYFQNKLINRIKNKLICWTLEK